jgi:hypothetical protein
MRKPPLFRLMLFLLAAGLSLSSPAWAAKPLATELPTPEGALAPRLTTAADGSVLLSWLEPSEPGRHLLRYSIRPGAGGKWSAATTVRAGDDWLVSWADPPAVQRVGDRFVATWLAKFGEGGGGSLLTVAWSVDGSNWSPGLVIHDDRSETEHGFATVVPDADGFTVLWLDGRGYAGGDEATRLYSRHVARDGQLGAEHALDKRACDCCPTASALLADGRAVVVYRDRRGGELRDVSLAIRDKGTWAQPRPVAEDNWDFGGCPVQGPVLAEAGGTLWALWYTEGGGGPRVKLARLGADGVPGKPQTVAAGDDILGRVAAAGLAGGQLAVAWVESRGKDEAWLRARIVDPSGRPAEALDIAKVPHARRAGFPSLAAQGQELLVVWRAKAEGVRGVTVELPASAQ